MTLFMMYFWGPVQASVSPLPLILYLLQEMSIATSADELTSNFTKKPFTLVLALETPVQITLNTFMNT